MCKDVGKSNCGNILFCGKLDPPKSNHQAVKLIKAHYSNQAHGKLTHDYNSNLTQAYSKLQQNIRKYQQHS